MYAKVENGQVTKFPYSLQKLREDNPLTSFPKEISEELAKSFGVYPVRVGSIPARDLTVQTLNRKAEPTLRDGQWWIDYEVEYLLQSQAEENIRIERDVRLAETDWVVTKSLESNVTVPTEMASYRQALRDITDQTGFPYSVVWPTKP